MLEVSNINAGYGKKQVLFDISFSLEEGQHLSIIGPNGSGKTTLLRVLDNLISYEGDVKLDGKNIKEMKRLELAQKVGFLSQLSELYFNFTVYDTVMMGRYAHHNTNPFSGVDEQDKEAVEHSLDAVSISDLRGREINTLSGGQLQRVFLAKVIAQDAKYILLDEPTNHLDLGYQVEFISFIKSWANENGKTVIGVLHDLNLAMLLTENVLLLESGSVASYSTLQQVLRDGTLDKAYNMKVLDYMKTSLSKFQEI